MHGGRPVTIDDTVWARMGPEARVRAAVGLLDGRGDAAGARPLGLGVREIMEIERDQPGPVGAAYRCFLTMTGGGFGRFLVSSDVFYPLMLGLREAAEDLLAERAVPFRFEAGDRVVLMHQGYRFDFLRGPGPDPEVWSYNEPDGPFAGPNATGERFTDWLRAAAEREAGLR
ncbi:hypothetical protein SAMN05216499_101334 [Actinacidiphila paucisporea]|uniref:SMI1/KNR4 family protein n=1 Tax=Actinacidiphila paucisporea TaxID=310782 RepID=A0A1M6UDU8_9ACTN|nr:hypothetical protein SAMN05216499_101334 [Actinacidiphila paucisporea]